MISNVKLVILKSSGVICHTIAVLTGFGSRASKRSLIVRLPMSGPVPCSGARRLGKGLDEVSTAIHGGAAAVNGLLTGCEFRAVLVKQQCYEIFHTFINISIPVPKLFT